MKPEEMTEEEIPKIEDIKKEDSWGRETSMMTEKDHNSGLCKKEDDLVD
tara:strand:- start:1131 stop:1277 length:147 start_codon:yes stop_codon:yes gene_type:complete